MIIILLTIVGLHHFNFFLCSSSTLPGSKVGGCLIIMFPRFCPVWCSPGKFQSYKHVSLLMAIKAS